MPSLLQNVCLELIQGDDYLAADSRAIVIIGAGVTWPALIASVKLLITPTDDCALGVPMLNIDGAYSAPTPLAAAQAAFDMTRVQSLTLLPGIRRYTFEVRALLAPSSVVTLARGLITALPGAL